MARPQKNNADYFSHDSSMRNDMKIKALRRKYGMEWYGLYCMLLEIIAGSDYFEYSIEENDYIAWEMFAGDVDIDTERLREIIKYMENIGLLHYSSWKIFSDGLKKRLQPVTEKRDQIRIYRESQKITKNDVWESKNDDKQLENWVCATQTIVCTTQMPQSKEKEIKEKEIKEKEIKEKEIKENKQVPACVFSFNDFFETYPKKTNQLLAEDLFAKLSNSEISEIMVRLPQFIDYWGTIEVRFVPAPDKFLSLKKWRDTIPPYKKMDPNHPVAKRKDTQEPQKPKEDNSKIWEYFLSLDEEYRSIIEKKATDKFAHLPIRNTDVLVKNEIILMIRSEFEKYKSQL